MRKAPVVVREVGVDDVRVTAEHQLLHLYDGLLGIDPPIGAGDHPLVSSGERPPLHRILIQTANGCHQTAHPPASGNTRFPAARYRLTGAGLSPTRPRQLRLTHRNRWFVDSPLEGDGFELLVPRKSPAWTSGSSFISRRYLQARTPPPDADEAVCDHCGLRVRERRLAAHDALDGLTSRTPREPARDTAVRSLASRPFPAA